MIYNTHDKEIIICTDCSGEGKISKKEFCQKEIETVFKTLKCKSCQGTGRLIKTTTIKYKPFKSNL